MAAMAIVDATVRLLPGVLGNADSTREESHSPDNAGLLEYSQYTRPAEFRGARVPAGLTLLRVSSLDDALELAFV